MKGFEYDSTRKDTAFQAMMQTAERVFDSCNKANCQKCAYHRPASNNMLVVCYTEKLADALITKGLIDRKAAEDTTKRRRAGKQD